MDNIDKGDQIKAGTGQRTQGAGMTTNTIRERSPNVPITGQDASFQRPPGLSDVQWQEQQALARQPGTTAAVLDGLHEDEDDGTPGFSKPGVTKGYDVAGLGNSST